MNVYHAKNDIILSGPHDIYSRWVREHTGAGNPECLTPEELGNYDLLVEVRPGLTVGQRYGGAYLSGGRALLAVEDTPSVDRVARDQAIIQICSTAKQLIESEVNPLGGFELVSLAASGKVRAAQVVGWVRDKYMAVEVRKAEVAAGLWDDDLSAASDLSWIGRKPWTIAQIFAE